MSKKSYIKTNNGVLYLSNKKRQYSLLDNLLHNVVNLIHIDIMNIMKST